jgi:hypothetical protein
MSQQAVCPNLSYIPNIYLNVITEIMRNLN